MKDNLLEFYVNKYKFIKDGNEPDLDFIPPIMRRRMSMLDKITLSNLNCVFSDNIQNIVFSSQYGEADRLNKLINQYTESKEVSPNTFSGSVHNYSEGFFLLNKQRSIPYTALASCEHSISMGLLTSVISNYENVLFCYADSANEQTISFAVNLTKNKTPQSNKYTIKLEKNDFASDKFDNYIKLFAGEIDSLKTPIYTIERDV